MKCQILFSGKNVKNIVNLSSAELAKRVVKFKILRIKSRKRKKIFHTGNYLQLRQQTLEL